MTAPQPASPVTATTGASVEFRHVTKSYDPGVKGPGAVNDLSLTVPAGKICVLVGPSGCGKTTSLKMVNRLIEPTSGRILIDGESVTSAPDGHYAFDGLRHHPLPVQPHLPIMIGGSGEKKTLRSVAKYADMWNAMGTVDTMRHKIDVLRQHCADVGRDPSEIEFTLGIKATIRDSAEEADKVWRAAMEHNRTPMSDVEDDVTFWNGTPEQLAERLAPYVELGFETMISEHPAPYDTESIERLIGQVKPLVDRG